MTGRGSRRGVAERACTGREAGDPALRALGRELTERTLAVARLVSARGKRGGLARSSEACGSAAAVAAGEDPKAIIRGLPGRIYAYHVKDRTPDGKMTSVGEGTIDFADIITLNEVAGVKHFYVENDQSPAPYLPDIQTSFAALSRLRA